MPEEGMIGEVVMSNTASFSAVVFGGFGEASPVSLGALIKTQTLATTIYGVVSLIEQSPTEQNRKVSPHGKSREELKKEMPQVFDLLQTEFRAIIVGYEKQGVVRQSLPPSPPNLHDFAFSTSTAEQSSFFSSSLSFIRSIFNTRDVSPDELFVALIRHHFTLIPRKQLIEIGKEVAYLLGDDHRRLESILTRLEE